MTLSRVSRDQPMVSGTESLLLTELLAVEEVAVGQTTSS